MLTPWRKDSPDGPRRSLPATPAVIFDLFGTLVPNFSRTAYDTLLAEMADTLGLPRSEFWEHWGASYKQRATCLGPVEAQIREVCDSLGVSPSRESLTLASALRIDFFRTSLTPRADALATLNAFRRANWRIGMISDCSAEVVMLWPQTLLASLVQAALFSCEEGVCKPDARIYNSACHGLGVAAGDCVYVGDGGSDELTGAEEVGMKAIMLRTIEDGEDAERYDVPQEWDGPTITRLADLLSLI